MSCTSWTTSPQAPPCLRCLWNVSGLQQSLQIDAEQTMGHLITDDDRRTLDVHTHLPRSHKPQQAILDVAREVKADLIIVGTQGRGGIARLFLGSVAERVVRTAPCPVLTVRELERDFVGPDALARFGEAALKTKDAARA